MNNFLKAIEYYEDGKISGMVDEGKQLKATCAGRGPENYTLSISFSGDDYSCSCTCPVGTDKAGHCKHIAALLLNFQEYITGETKTRGKRSAADDKKIRDKISELAPYTLPILKQMLKANDQSTTGTKAVLLERVAEGTLFGKLPRCEKCGGGRLKIKEGIGYYCPGYMEDDQMIDCDFFATEVKRTPWANAEI